MPIERNKADQTISVRVSLDLLHKIEKRVAAVAAARADPNPPWHPQSLAAKMSAEYATEYPATISGLTRRALEYFFEFMDDPRGFVLAHCAEEIRTEVETVLARAVHDTEARDALRRIAAKHEPDFG